MMKQKRIRTPGSRNVAHRVARRTSAPTCSECGALLHGVKKMSTVRFAGAAASLKSVNRKFGGSLCVACSRETLRQKARVI